MKTAILKTNIWDDDDFYELNIDTKLLYLLLLSSPERGISDIYKVSDRILSARSGLNPKQIEVCKKQLAEQNLVVFFDKHVKLTDLSYVQPTSGRFTAAALERELKTIPVHVAEFFDGLTDEVIPEEYQKNTSTALVHKDIDNNKDKDIDKGKDNETLKEFRELNKYWSEQSGRKLSENKTSIAAFKKIRKEYDVSDIQLAINGAVFYQGMKYKPQVMSFASLYEKWDNLSGHMITQGKEKSNETAPIF